ncbi:histidine phosphatase family protein [Leptothoe spongobia]|uniref:Histidine phosphatase family protein n=1 Tax=Leptothoe spongobia TAU-MAC 1115 TaxID=1967444 RepID=A0A947DEG1_9CYAN|nr:histidine phosphatase family protein [Leptothoe spongobia]MBT9315527.1 histidine phosphatase family protein [Leptothoe spongobia TAU-MAC 1115]
MRTDRPPSRIILVRHGRSTFNDQGRYQGSSDQAVLTPTGIKTARQVGQYLKSIAIDAVYTSPLLRAKQTAGEILKAMADKRPKPITVSNDLREIDLSVWEGLTYEHVRHHHKDIYDCWQQRPEEFKLPYSDSNYHFPVNDLYERAQRFWTHSLPHYSGKTVLIVSHGGTNHALISTALDLRPKHHHRLQQSNCGISVLEFSGHGVTLNQLNQTTVIKEILPKLKAGKQGLRLLLLPEDSLTSVACKQLAHRLAAIKLDFCLSVTAGQQWLHTLLRYHPSITQFADERDDFLQDWHQGGTEFFGSTQELMTGLAITPTPSIQTLLMQTLGGRPYQGEKLSIKPGQLSVIHYPQSHRPVVQAINI